MKKYYIYIHLKRDTKEVFYVGKGVNNRAYSNHHRNNHWHNTVIKHGLEVVITDYYATKDEYDIAEIELIAEYRSLGCELVNQTPGGDGGSAGRVWKLETRKKISKAVAGENNGFYGHNHTAEAKERISRANLGENNFFYNKNHSEEAKEKMRRAWKKRKPISEETRKKLSESRTGKNNHRYGKTVSEETKMKMRLKALVRRPSQETKNKISKSLTGKKRKPSISTELSNLLIET